MTDRHSERDYINAKKFAESIGSNRLKDGTTVLEQLPYFSEQMRLAGLNPNFLDHCKLAKQSLEERLKAAGSEMIVRPSEELSELNNPLLDGFYKVKENLFRIYEKYFPLERLGLAPFKTEHKTLIGCSTVININANSLYIETIDNNESTREIPLRLATIKIERTWFKKRLKATAACTYTYYRYELVFGGLGDYYQHLKTGPFSDFDQEAEVVSKSFYSPNNQKLSDRFEDYLNNVFSMLPDKIEKGLEEAIVKRKLSPENAAELFLKKFR